MELPNTPFLFSRISFGHFELSVMGELAEKRFFVVVVLTDSGTEAASLAGL